MGLRRIASVELLHSHKVGPWDELTHLEPNISNIIGKFDWKEDVHAKSYIRFGTSTTQ